VPVNMTIQLGQGSDQPVVLPAVRTNHSAKVLGRESRSLYNNASDPYDFERELAVPQGTLLITRFSGHVLAGAGQYEIRTRVDGPEEASCLEGNKADVFVSAGLYSVGFPYLNIDRGLLEAGTYQWSGHFSTSPPAPSIARALAIGVTFG